MYGKSNMETYITISETDSQWEFSVWLRKLKQELCINLVGWDGEGGGRFKKEGIYVYLWLIHVEVWQKQQNSVKQLSFNKKKFKKEFKMQVYFCYFPRKNFSNDYLSYIGKTYKSFSMEWNSLC